MSISTSKEADYKEWADQWKQYLAFYKTELPESQHKNTFSRLIAEDGDLSGFVIRHDEGGTIVGLAHYFTHQNAWMDKPVCYLNDLFVDSSTRGKGYGRKLIMATSDAAEKLGCTRVYWTTQHTNTTARRLYDTLATTEFTCYRTAPFDTKN